MTRGGSTGELLILILLN